MKKRKLFVIIVAVVAAFVAGMTVYLFAKSNNREKDGEQTTLASASETELKTEMAETTAVIAGTTEKTSSEEISSQEKNSALSEEEKTQLLMDTDTDGDGLPIMWRWLFSAQIFP